MNKNIKKVTIRFYSIVTVDNFLNNISSIYSASEQKIRIFNYREKKYFMKINHVVADKEEIYFLSVVRERNTWQAKALRDGSISGIQPNQGIMGDTYYFYLVPAQKVLLGFTTGTTDSLKAVGKVILMQFQKDRNSNTTLEAILADNKVMRIEDLIEYKNLEFKVNFNEMGEIGASAPDIIRDLSLAASVAGNAEVSIKFPKIEEKVDLLSIINFLEENEACSKLTVEGKSQNGDNIKLDFTNSLLVYKGYIETKDNFIDEANAQRVLTEAIDMLPN